jgi:RNA-dependent RNA polymerase
MGEWEGKPRWYGGQIQQVARITTANKHSTDPYASFALSLEPLEQRKSNRFARVLGSRRMLQVSIPEDMARGEQSEKLRRFMAQKFVICGRVFVSFHAKDGHVYLMETDQNYERCADMEEGDQHRISLTSFVDWHNPLDLNYKQVMVSKFLFPSCLLIVISFVSQYPNGRLAGLSDYRPLSQLLNF